MTFNANPSLPSDFAGVILEPPSDPWVLEHCWPKMPKGDDIQFGEVQIPRWEPRTKPRGEQ